MAAAATFAFTNSRCDGGAGGVFSSPPPGAPTFVPDLARDASAADTAAAELVELELEAEPVADARDEEAVRVELAAEAEADPPRPLRSDSTFRFHAAS